MNQKCITFDGKNWELLQLTKSQKNKLEEHAKKEHETLMKDCIIRANNILNQEYQEHRIDLALAIYNSEVTHTAFYKEEFLEKKKARLQKESKEQLNKTFSKVKTWEGEHGTNKSDQGIHGSKEQSSKNDLEK